MELVKAGEHRIAVEIADGNDPPVVLVSAMGEPGSAWKPVIEHLTTGPQVIAYDRHGIGASPPRAAPNPPLSYRAFAAELALLAGTIGVTRPVVAVGHSLGSLIVRMLAVHDPGLVAGIVPVDGSVPRLILWPGADSTADGDGPDATEVDTAAGLNGTCQTEWHVRLLAWFVVACWS